MKKIVSLIKIWKKSQNKRKKEAFGKKTRVANAGS